MRKTFHTLMVSSALILTPVAFASIATAANEQSDKIEFTSKQQLGEVLADALIGQNVKNMKNEVIGDINNLIITNQDKVSVAIVGVGGFLGMGEKNVAIPFKDLRISINQDGTRNIKVDTTKDVLQKAPEFKKLPK